jgi:hypothetical protein
MTSIDLAALDPSSGFVCAKSALSPHCGDPSCNVGPRFSLGDTNQRLCYDNGGAACVSLTAPECFVTKVCGQDGQYGWDTANLPAARWQPSVDSKSNAPTVTDAATGLLWQGCSAGQRGTTCTGDPTWLTYNEAVTYCATLRLAGVSGWQVPDLFALHSLLDLGKGAGSTAMVEASSFPNTTTMRSYWSSTYSAAGNLWTLSFTDGTDDRNAVTARLPVRCVKVPVRAFSFPRFVPRRIQADEWVVDDRHTGLTWLRCALGAQGEQCTAGTAQLRRWKGALSDCENLDFAGQTDWRLPNISELRSIADFSATRPGLALDEQAFPNTPASSSYWSSTTAVQGTADSGTHAWVITFSLGNTWFSEKTQREYVRCVRGTP